MPRSVHRSALVFLTIGLSLGSIVFDAGASRAQDESSAAAAPVAPNTLAGPRNLLPLLNRLDYDTGDRPPLLVVDAVRWVYMLDMPDGKTNIARVADSTRLRLVSAGGIKALVPPTMTVINGKPARANPFAGMQPGETLKVLLGTLTRAQWHSIGDTNGIGLGDLTEDQKLLWREIVPAELIVRKNEVRGAESSTTPAEQTEIDQTDGVRLRLNKRMTFMFSKSGAKDYSWGGNPYQGENQTGLAVVPAYRHTAMGTDDRTSAFGVKLIAEENNRLKPSAIDYDSPSLDAPVSLHFAARPPVTVTKVAIDAEMPPGFNQPEMTEEDIQRLPAKVRDQLTPEMREQTRSLIARMRGDAAEVVVAKPSLPTIGDILRQIGKTTHLDLLADRRVRDSPVFLRGESARSGDVLQALARSVTGSFRKIDGVQGEPPIYLLTSDIDSVGARAARLNDWAEDAVELKYKMMDGIVEKIAKLDPVADISFATGDKYAINSGQTKALEESWQLDDWGMDIKRDDMSSALRLAVDAYRDFAYESGTSLRNDRVKVSEEFGLYAIIPGMGEAQDFDVGNEVSGQFLQQISLNPNRVAATKTRAKADKAKAMPLPPGFPAKLRRRVLLAKPGNTEEATALVAMAARKGLTDIWLQVGVADMPATVALLKAATVAGAHKITVGGAISLLQGGGVPGEPERNILGETGEEYRKRLQDQRTAEERAEHRSDFDQSLGWTVPDRAEMASRLKVIADTPGLGGLVLLSTAAPGWTGEKQGGDDILIELGYSLETRRQFLKTYGIDPIDIPDRAYPLRTIAWGMGPFPLLSPTANYVVVNGHAAPGPAGAAPRSDWLAFRAQENIRMLSALYVALKKQRPDLPLFLDDRVSPYGGQRPLSWYGSWDVANRVPVNPPFAVESEGHAAARLASKTIFADWGWWWSAAGAAKAGAPADFAVKVTAAAYRNGPPEWDGMAMDMTGVPPADLLRLLAALPDAAPPVRTGRP